MKVLIKTNILLLLLSLSLMANSLPVPITNPIYLFLKRLETRGIISRYNDSVLPLTRNKLAEYLKEAGENRSQLNNIEREILTEFLADYRPELRAAADQTVAQGPFISDNGLQTTLKNIGCRSDNREETHLFSYEDNNNFLWADFDAAITSQHRDGKQRFIFYDAYSLRSGFGEHITATVQYWRYTRHSSGEFSEPLDVEAGNWNMYHEEFNSVMCDNLYSSLSYNNTNFTIRLSNQPVLWGTSYHNNLILADKSPSFPHIGLSYDYKGVRLSFLHASLLNDSTANKSVGMAARNCQKHLAINRFDIPLFKGKINIGLTDLVIYGGRGMELAYLSPINFYWAADHALMDRDNALVAFDIKAKVMKNFSLYGSFLLDELKLGALTKQWWANKQALQVGALLALKIKGFPTDIQAEFSAVHPWTYSHKSYVSNYTHNGIILGFPYGPNSRVVFLRSETYLSRRTRLSFFFNHVRHGEDDGSAFYGGDPTVPYTLRDPKYDNDTKWLMGSIKKTNLLKCEIEYELFNDSFLLGGIEYITESVGGENQNSIFVNIGVKVNI